jgi:hypothetical protein
MAKKYDLIKSNVTIGFMRKSLYQLRALVNIEKHGVKAGDLGGYVEDEKNLSHGGSAWISQDARVFGDAKVFDNALVSDSAQVSGTCQVFGNAWVFGDSVLTGDARICGV